MSTTLKIDYLMQEAVFVSLHIGRWRGRSSLQYRDLGIPDADDENGLFKLGTKILYPRVPADSMFYDPRRSRTYADVLDSLEQSARAFLRGETILVGDWGRLMKVALAPDFESQVTRRYRNPYFSARDEILARWDELFESLVSTYKQLGDTARERFERLTGKDGGTLAELGEQIEMLLPQREEFAKSFRFEIEFKFFDIRAWVGDSVAAQALANPLLAAENVAFQEALAARRAIEAQNTAKWAEKQAEILNAIMEQTRLVLYNAATDILMGLEDAERRSRATKQLAALAETVRKFTFIGDEEGHQIKKALDHLVSLGEARTAGDTEEILRAVATLARGRLLELNVRPRWRAETLGVPDDPTPADKQRARQRLEDFSAEMEALPDVRRRTH